MSATVFFADPASELATLTNIFKVGGTPTDATTVTLTITDPTGVTSTPSVTHSGTGTYTANVACTTVGVPRSQIAIPTRPHVVLFASWHATPR